MPLDVGFGWRPAKASHVFCNERKVLDLPLGGPLSGTLRRRQLRLTQRNDEFFGAGVDDKSDATREINGECLTSVSDGTCDFLTYKGSGKSFRADGSWRHEDAVTGVPGNEHSAALDF